MGCVNVNSPEYKSLVSTLEPRERMVARAVISKYQTERNTESLPDSIELKGLVSDLYNTPQAGVDYPTFYSEVRKVFKSLIPSITEKDLDEKVQFMDKLDVMRLRGGLPVLTTFINNTVYIANSLPQDRGTQAYNDIRHEVFHMVFNNYLTEKEQETVIESFKNLKPNFKDEQDKVILEEAMADLFEDYKYKSRSFPKIISDFFAMVFRYFGWISNNYNDINRLFSDLNNGKFTKNFVKDSLVTRDKSIINEDPDFKKDLDLFLQAKAFMVNNLNELMYPKDIKNLQEDGNSKLFLVRQETPGLFASNQEIFKLGLTKEDALSELQNRLKILKASNVVDPQLEKVINVLTKNNFGTFKKLFDYLQPYSIAKVDSHGELSLTTQAEIDPTIDLSEPTAENVMGLEIGSKELINPVTKISEVVKDFLTSVTYQTSQGNFQNIDPGAGFISLLDLMGSMYGNTSVEDNLQSLIDNYKGVANKSNATKAVYEKVKILHEALQSSNRVSVNLKGVPQAEITDLKAKLDAKSIKYEVFKDNMTIVIPETMKMENKGTNSSDNEVLFTFNRSKQGERSFLIRQKEHESNKTYVEKVARETDLPSFVIAKLFNYNEQRNQLAEITKVANSLRKLSPKFVKISSERVTDPDSGESAMDVSFSFVNKVNEYKSSGSYASEIRAKLDIPAVRSSITADTESYSSLKNKNDRTGVKSLLESVLVNKLGVITKSDFSKISDKNIYLIFNALERIVDSVPDFKSAKPSVEFDNSDVYLRHTSKLGNLISNYSQEKNSPTSFNVSTAKKSKWENVMKNTSYMIFKNLEDFSLGIIKAKNLLPYLRNSFNNYLRFNPLLVHDYANKTFSVNNSLLRVGEEDYVADHQETYFESKANTYAKQPIPFSKESPRDWINRNFLAMFQIPVLENQSKSKTSDFSYFQQKFQPESAPNVSVVKMGIQSADNLQNNIKMMIVQEAFMNYKYGTSNRGNLKKNTQKSTLPGLEGTTYFLKNNVNSFFDGFGNLSPEIGAIKNGKLVLNPSRNVLDSLSKTIMENLDQSLTEFTQYAIDEKSTLIGSEIAQMYEKLQNSYMKQYKLSDKEMASLKSFGVDNNSDIDYLKTQESYPAQFAAMKKAMSVFYMNSFVNGYFMNQLSSGVTQNYKTPLDEVKRQAGVNAMNDTGLIDDKHGMPNTYRNVVISSAYNFYGKSHQFSDIPLLRRFFKNKKNEVGDAQSWDIPEYKQLLRKSFGKSVDMGVITKDVHFEINEDGAVEYRKTSSAELTNELVQKNSTLRELRFAMTFQPYLDSLPVTERTSKEQRIRELYNQEVDQNGIKNVDSYMEYQNVLEDVADTMIHKASFESAIKGAKPSKMSSFTKNKETGTHTFNLEKDSILQLNSTYNGIQQAVRHRAIDGFISHFTQLTYLIGLNRTETSIKNNKIITRTLSKFAKSGIYDTLFQYRMGYEDGKLKINRGSKLKKTKKQFQEDLKKKLDLPGNDRLIALLDTPDISMNNPLFSEKLMQSFFNSFTKKTVTPKHPGGKFVLQSEFGFEANRILTENSMRTPELKIDDKKNILYAEVYLPEMYGDQLKVGEMIYYSNPEYSNMFGFRIPSSDLHSSVPLRVIGFYPSKSQDNVVVIPSAVTSLHGSDFDVDSLFVVRYGVYGVSEEDIDPKDPDQVAERDTKREFKTKFQENNRTIAQKGVKFGYTVPSAQYDSRGNLVDFGDNNHIPVFAIDGVLTDEKEKTQKKILDLEKESNSIPKATTLKQRQDNSAAFRKFNDEIKGLEEHLKTLKNIQKGVYSNTILDAVMDNISYMGENANDILFGITFDPVKGYDEGSEYSKLAQVYSDINKSKGVEDLIPERPKMYSSLNDASLDPNYQKIKLSLENNFGIDTESKAGKEDLLALVNQELEDSWIAQRDAFIAKQRGAGNININKVEKHVNVHRETYMAADLVGIIANFSKGLAYSFHGITDSANHIELDISDKDMVVIDGVKMDKLVIENKDGIKNQELKSLALNAAIDHVKEQILNVLNVGEKTVKIFLAAISTEMTMHQATMMMLQPVAKELNTSSTNKPSQRFNEMITAITEKLVAMKNGLTTEEIDKLQVNTKDLEPLIKTSFNELINDTKNPKYREQLMLQLKVIQQLAVLDRIGTEVSDVSRALSIIQGLPYNLESAYGKLKDMTQFIDVAKFYNKLAYSEKSEYTQPGFKDDLKSAKSMFKNVNLANNENVLGALEAIKTQIDVTSEMFTENSLQMQFLVNNIIKAISDNSDPSTLFTGPNDQNLTFDSTSKMTTEEKYLKGQNTYMMTKIIARNIFNYLTSGLNIPYNNGNVFSLSVQDQKLTEFKIDNTSAFYGPVKSFLNEFLLENKDMYDPEKYPASQINKQWKLKPLSLIKQENPDNRFLKNLGIDTNYRDKVRIMTFNSELVNSAENLAEVEKAINELGNLRNIYLKQDKNGKWIDLPSNEHPHTFEMNEIVFNIIKASLYTDKLKFSSSKVTNVIPPTYFQDIFKSLDTVLKDLIYFNKSKEGNKYFKDFGDNDNQSRDTSVISDIKENLFINTIFSVSKVLPKIDGKYSFDNKVAGILQNGNIYDLMINAVKLEDKPVDPGTIRINTPASEDTTNTEVDEDVQEAQAENDLYNKFRQNPSFLVETIYKDRRSTGRYDLYMKVGQTGTKETNDLRYYYKKIGIVDEKITNNSFNSNLLISKYKIKDYFNPTRFAIPVKNLDINIDKLSMSDVTISSFIVNKDNTPTAVVTQKIAEMRQDPKNESKTNKELETEIRKKINVETVIKQVKEVSLYDSRNIDRIGMRSFRVTSYKISSDRSKISFELEALPKSQQVTLEEFDSPYVAMYGSKANSLSMEEKIKYINSIPGAKKVTSDQNLSEAEIQDALERARAIDEEKEVEEVIKKKKCK